MSEGVREGGREGVTEWVYGRECMGGDVNE